MSSIEQPILASHLLRELTDRKAAYFPQNILSEADFCKALHLERKRTERSKRGFVLLFAALTATESSHRITCLRRAVAVLRMISRETDFAGWHIEGRTLGMVFPEVDVENQPGAPGVLIARIIAALRDALPFDDFSKVQLTFQVFPEDHVS